MEKGKTATMQERLNLIKLKKKLEYNFFILQNNLEALAEINKKDYWSIQDRKIIKAIRSESRILLERIA